MSVSTLRQIREIVRRSASRLPGAQSITFARSFTATVLRSYWHELQKGGHPIFHFAHLPAGLELADLGQADENLASAAGRAAASVDPLEAGYLIGATYTATLPNDIRSRHGIFYTPPAVALRLVEMASATGINWSLDRVLDPACGGGAFLAHVAARISAHLADCEPLIQLQNIASRLRGFEIDPFAAWMSQVLLDSSLLPLYRRAGERLPQIVEICDALERLDVSGAFDLVIGNPPYGRVSLGPRQRKQFARSLYGHANLYGLFTDLALRWTKQGGVIAYVTPTSFLGGEYYCRLRHLLLAGAPPLQIEFINDRRGVFDDVLQETTLATYRRGAPPKGVTVNFLTVREDTGVDLERGASISLPRSGSGPWIVPRRPQQCSLVDRLLQMPHRLNDYGYSVSTGPLVWNRHKTQLRRARSRKTLPLIWAEAVEPTGTFRFKAEKRGHVPWFEMRPGDGWLASSKACILVQRTTAKEQRRRLIAAELPQRFLDDHGGAVIENHLNMVRPTGGKAAISPAAIAALLNSAAVDAAFRCISGSVAVSASELEALPLPNPDEMEELMAMLQAGSDHRAFEARVAAFYDGSPE